MTEQSATPRLSATILLLRDAPDLQVLMVERHYQIDFAAGALVFPGGKACDDDSSPDWAAFCDGSTTGVQRTAQIAAIREAYEETGLLLARPVDGRGLGAPMVDQAGAARLAPFREGVDRGEISFLDLMRDNGLVLACDALVHFGHWITPEMMPKRFDTHFYMAPTPAGQKAVHDGRETTEAVWVNPASALQKEADGPATIIFPTRMYLLILSEAASAAAALSNFAQREVVTVLPKLDTDDDGKPCLRIPEQAGYGQTLEPLERVKV